MLRLSALYLSRDHFNHMCSIEGKIAKAYIFASRGKIDTIFLYESLGSFQSVNKSQCCCFKIFGVEAGVLKPEAGVESEKCDSAHLCHG